MFAAVWADRAARRPSFAAEAPHWIITMLGGVLLLGVRTHDHQGPGRLWDIDEAFGWSLVAVAMLGFGFCWWARLHLGRLWSGTVTRKVDHHIVDTGPYALVRHPIYTGIILAAFATGALKGTIVALAGAATMTLGFWTKARLEERFLRQEMGSDAYDAYSRRTPMIVPSIPRRG
ncbi:MAG TPA: isoprenylcysteine carboxylmethyltransferase family protein [Caulobacteraceae bacterium]